MIEDHNLIMKPNHKVKLWANWSLSNHSINLTFAIFNPRWAATGAIEDGYATIQSSTSVEILFYYSDYNCLII